MRLLFIADGRSSIALNWIDYFLESGYEVHLVSTFHSEPDPRLAGYHLVPVAFSWVAGAGKKEAGTASGFRSARLLGLRTKVRQWLGPFTLSGAARRLHDVVETVQPDLVHALRIPYEGMLAAAADVDAPLLVSVWGNDFTLHAPANPLMAYYTRVTLAAVQALHADCHRDVRLARIWGLAANKPAIVFPGNGGVQVNIFHLPNRHDSDRKGGAPVVINPRGFRAYVRNDTFFRAIPLILEKFPSARFVCPTMEAEASARKWIEKLGIRQAVELLPRQTHAEMAELFRRAHIAVSPSTHDGTPNTVLEAMACGCFPVVGDLESLREWIKHEENGLLFDPRNHSDLAKNVVRVIEDAALRHRAVESNQRIIHARAAYHRVMPQVESFYRQLL